jgi:hypothetical protein
MPELEASLKSPKEINDRPLGKLLEEAMEGEGIYIDPRGELNLERLARHYLIEEPHEAPVGLWEGDTDAAAAALDGEVWEYHKKNGDKWGMMYRLLLLGSQTFLPYEKLEDWEDIRILEFKEEKDPLRVLAWMYETLVGGLTELVDYKALTDPYRMEAVLRVEQGASLEEVDRDLERYEARLERKQMLEMPDPSEFE